MTTALAECFAAIHVCRIRATRLDATGHPLGGPNNVFVSSNQIQLGVTPVILPGEDKDLPGGCDCLLASYKGRDKLKRYDFELDQGKLEPALQEMLLGASAIANSTSVIGVWWQDNAYSCAADAQPNICLEAWEEAITDDYQDPVFPWVHWIWPSTFWQIAPFTIGSDFAQPKMTGFSRGNLEWGVGIYGDLPEAAQALGGYFFTDIAPPVASCSYQTQALT